MGAGGPLRAIGLAGRVAARAQIRIGHKSLAPTGPARRSAVGGRRVGRAPNANHALLHATLPRELA